MLLSHRHMDFLASGAVALRTGQTFTQTEGASNPLSTEVSPKFGTYSIDGQSNGSFTSVGHNDTNFTFECWVRRISSWGSSGYTSLIGSSSGGSTTVFGIGIFQGRIVTVQNTSGNNVDFSRSATLDINTWHHIAVTKSSGTIRVFFNGVEATEGSKNLSGTLIGSGHVVRFGASGLGDAGGQKYLDEIRLSNTIRYNANFTPPSTAFTNDADTVLLAHCEEWPLVDDVN